MLCYAAKLMRAPAMVNPTLVLITDRNDLDDQLFGEVFAPARILPEEPQQATSRAELRQLLDRVSGGIIFTTIQKFAPEERGDVHPVLTDRRNVVVIADEAHRTQYDFLDGFARHLRDALPNATYLGFTGTPLETSDRRPARSSATTSTSTTSPARSRTARPSDLLRVAARQGAPARRRSRRDRRRVADVTEGHELDEAERRRHAGPGSRRSLAPSERLDLIAADSSSTGRGVGEPLGKA